MENTYVVYDSTKEAIIIDPGCYETAERKELTDFIDSEALTVTKIINTHCHIDHVLGNYYVTEKYKVALYIHKDDLATLRAVKSYAPSYGFTNYTETIPEFFLEEGIDLSFGESEFKILFVPGHAPGHIALYNKENNILIAGDVLFRNSIGRTDLPGGDYDTLIDSIKSKVFKLPEQTIVYCGHGESTTVGFEMRTNPFCKVL